MCPRELIAQVLSEHERHSQRQRLLPASAVAYYVMALALWREAPQEEVVRIVCKSLYWLSRGQQAQPDQIKLPKKGSISKAHTRLGMLGAWWRQWPLMAPVSMLPMSKPMPCTLATLAPRMVRARIRKCGTHVVTAATLAPCKQGASVAEPFLPDGLQADMLMMADRGFYSFKL